MTELMDRDAARVAAEGVSIELQIATIERELKYRRRVYPRLVASGKMTEKLAAQHIWHLLAVLGTLQRLAPAPAQESLL